MAIQTVHLENGEIPILGLGTWKLTGKECIQNVREALELGYTHIDTAQMYGNHEEIAQAINDYEREALWITSKIWRDQLDYKQVHKTCQQLLEELQTDYLDLLLIHWPNNAVDMNETLKALVELREAGKIKNLGVSNFTIKHLEDVEAYHNDISVNQVEYHPQLNQEELRRYCEDRNIKITAYSPLAHGNIIENELLEEIGKNHGASTAQVAIKWLTQKGLITIPKASSHEHLQENLESLNFELTQEEMQQIDTIGEQKRYVNPPFADF